MQELIKKTGKHVVAIAIFLALSLGFFAPAVFNGKVLTQGDHIKAVGMGGSQVLKYAAEAAPGDYCLWSDGMFSGMPYVQGYGHPGPDLPGYYVVDRILKMPGYSHAAMIFTGLVCFYLFLCILGVNWWLALGGAIAFAFASYNIIIIEAGHIVKAYVIGYMPLTLAGMALLFRRKYLWGSVVFLLGVALSLANGHIQITYYLVLLALFIYLGYTINKIIKEKSYGEWCKTTIVMAACVIFAVLPNASQMYSNWDLGQHSIRGQSELTPKANESGVVEKVSTGLDKTYAFQWSYGWQELLTVMIPNACGGSSGGTVGADSHLVRELKSKGAQVGKEVQTYTYWGDKAFTSGPVYFGALVCFLFVLGMFVVRSSMKWWMFGGAVFLTFMALGRNFDAFNDLMFHHLPLYNKFRTVEMALVIPGMVFPIIGIWGLSVVLKRETDDAHFKKAMIWSYAITGGLCFIVCILPSMLLDFTSPADARNLASFPGWYVDALMADRKGLASSDAFRSLVIITIGAAALLFFWMKMKGSRNAVTVISAIIAIIMLIDLWNIDRRYINDKSYTTESPEQTYKAGVANEIILKDPTPSFRVFGLNNPWQNTDVSYFHHSIGGYHAVKLRRYNELIERRLDKEHAQIIEALGKAKSYADMDSVLAFCPSLNMLDMRYIIFDATQPPLFNPHAFGNCRFIKSVMVVETADAEIDALNHIDPFVTAVVDKRFSAEVKDFVYKDDPDASIIMEHYHPGRLIYKSKANSEQIAVFSEIYYDPGWKVTIDGKEATHFRADWILRAMKVPAGEHTIKFEFKPDTYIAATYVSIFSSFFILLLLVGAAGYTLWKNRKGLVHL
ncbi:MAG: YfhO family protein [Tannerellaceae bacterium]|nr:YfhO family protein [Tannerellaceae bacterium]